MLKEKEFLLRTLGGFVPYNSSIRIIKVHAIITLTENFFT